MSVQVSKDEEIGGKKYRIGRVSAKIGTWIALKLRSASESDFQSMQEHLLKVCSVYNTAGLSPILMADGSWAEKDLEFDTATATKLFLTALDFNVGSFFADAASEGKSAQSAATSQSTPSK
jgi:hypothetical protein